MTGYEPPDWMHQGRCVTTTGTLIDTFFPGRGQPTKPAKQICAQCPVLDVCREYALENIIRFGIWGGMSERERRAERQRRALTGEPVVREPGAAA